MSSRFKLSCIILILYCWPQVSAQFVGKPYVINYEKRTYGAGNQNWSIAVGRDGLVYFGNDSGLLEFDGSNWNLYTMPDNGIVRSVTVGDDNNIYVCSYLQWIYWFAPI